MNVSNYIELLKVLQTMDDYKFIVLVILAVLLICYSVFKFVVSHRLAWKCLKLKERGQNIDLILIGVSVAMAATGVWLRLRRI